MNNAKYEYTFLSEVTGEPTEWRRIQASSERDAADAVARMVGSTCPVPGAYRPGRKPARLVGEHRYVMPTGARVVIRECATADDALEALAEYVGDDADCIAEERAEHDADVRRMLGDE